MKEIYLNNMPIPYVGGGFLVVQREPISVEEKMFNFRVNKEARKRLQEDGFL